MDPTLLQIFATEQSEHVDRIRAIIDTLPSLTRENRGGAFDELLRRAHTLKGAARAVGIQDTELLMHRMESVFSAWRKADRVPSSQELRPVHRTLDGAEDILAAVLGTRSAPDIEPLLKALGATESPPSEASDQPHPELQRPTAASLGTAPGAQELVRVQTALLDQIVRASAQLLSRTHEDAANAAQVSEHAAACSMLVDEFSRLSRNTMVYLREQADTAETQAVTELLSFVDTRLRSLATSARRIATSREQHTATTRRLVDDLADQARQARMIPAEAVFVAFGAMVRELASAEGKEITYRSHGLELQADRDVLQALKDPVMHLLRNAVSHGIEAPRERVAAGQPAAGTISLSVDVQERRFAVTVEDDGRGLDLNALSRLAVESGVMTEAAAAEASTETLARLIFLPGLSTAKSVSALSGRGFGLSAVAAAASALQGDVTVQRGRSRGTAITITVPTSILTHSVLLFRQGAHTYGIPNAFVRQLVRFRSADVRLIDGVDSIVYDNRPVPLISFGDLIGYPEDVANNNETVVVGGHRTHQAVILEPGSSLIALVVAELLDSRQTVVRPTGLPGFAAGWSVGAIPLENGSAAVMLSAELLVRARDGAARAAQKSFLPAATERPRARILVVDDSVTTRSMERSLLEANGFEVQVAVDGAEAWTMISENPPQLVISDVNMPNMDGFQLLEQIKAKESTATIPVILVTSLDSKEEQERGLLLGADAYIVKRKFDHRELLRVVRQII